MIDFCIASPHKNELWYDYRLYVNLKEALVSLGFRYRAASKNRIYFLGAPQLQFYPEVGKFDPQANNIALVYCHVENLTSINQYDSVFVCSDYFKEYLENKGSKCGDPGKDESFDCVKAINVIRPFSSLQPATQTMPRYKCDVSFMGTPRKRPALEALLPLVEPMGIKLNLYGPGWDRYEGNYDLEQYWIARQIPYEDIPKLARGSKICLIDHLDTMNEIGSVSHKYIDFVMSGGFVISDHNKDAINTYNGVCFDDQESLKALLEAYLFDEEKRQRHATSQQIAIVNQTTRSAAAELAKCFIS